MIPARRVRTTGRPADSPRSKYKGGGRGGLIWNDTLPCCTPSALHTGGPPDRQWSPWSRGPALHLFSANPGGPLPHPELMSQRAGRNLFSGLWKRQAKPEPRWVAFSVRPLGLDVWVSGISGMDLDCCLLSLWSGWQKAVTFRQLQCFVIHCNLLENVLNIIIIRVS